MRILQQIGVVFSICILAEIISSVLPFTFPGSVISMVLLLILLFLKLIKEDNVKDISDFLLKNMAFFFLPAGVGIINSWDVLKTKLFIFIAVCVISFILTFIATAVTVKFVIKLQGGDENA